MKDKSIIQAHDPGTPKALIDFMTKQWAPQKVKVNRLKNARYFESRRNTLCSQFPGETLIIPTGREKVRANDTYFRFRPSSDFYYLTGCLESDCVLVLEFDGKSRLFVEPRTRGDASFFTDRVKGELWAGPRLGVDASQKRYGVHKTESLRKLESYLSALKAPYRILRGVDEIVEDMIPSQSQSHDQIARDKDFAVALSENRLLKDKTEVQELQESIRSTHRGFEDVIKRLKIAKSEREIEGVFNLRARVEGNDVGYNTIAASGAHACILHWIQNDGAVKKGDLFLLDAGVEGNSLYTADVTRTIPVSGKFSKPQKKIYQLVLDSQIASIKVIKPGVDFLEPYRVAMKILVNGLIELGILKCSAVEALSEDKQLHRRYTLHAVSHMLGLDVHDCAKARSEFYKYGKLKEGMVLTVEPGLYFQPDDLTVPKEYRGIGIRIEDDVLVTRTGYRNLSASIPKTVEGIEAWMKKTQATC